MQQCRTFRSIIEKHYFSHAVIEFKLMNKEIKSREDLDYEIVTTLPISVIAFRAPGILLTIRLRRLNVNACPKRAQALAFGPRLSDCIPIIFIMPRF